MTAAAPGPNLTIGIPTYQRAEALAAQLARLRQVPGADLEILVSDNGSTDDTAAVCASAAAADPRVRCLRNGVNVGIDVNVLRLVEAARGTWCWLLGDDERIDVSQVEPLVARLATADADVLHLIGAGCALAEGQPSRFETPRALVDNFYDLGRMFHLSSNVLRVARARPLLREAYPSCGLLHAYGALAVLMLRSGSALAILDLPLLTADASSTRPRWNVLLAHLGAWQTLRQSMPAELRPRVDRKQARSRFKAIFRSALLDAFGARRYGFSASELGRLLRIAPLDRWPLLLVLSLALRAHGAPVPAAALVVVGARLAWGRRSTARLRELYDAPLEESPYFFVSRALRERASSQGSATVVHY